MNYMIATIIVVGLFVSCPVGMAAQAPAESKVKLQIIGRDEDNLNETVTVVVSPQGTLRDVLAHDYTEDSLKQAFLGKKKVVVRVKIGDEKETNVDALGKAIELLKRCLDSTADVSIYIIVRSIPTRHPVSNR